MALDPDILIDRRKLKRRLFFWRTIAFLGLAGLAIGGYIWKEGPDTLFGGQDRIARITISGFIATDRKLVDLMERTAKDDHVKGVIVALNTPGGSTSGGEALYEAVRELAKKKPTVAHVETLAASAGYMIALGADQIIARRTALTGSIGVLMQWPDASRLLDTIGVKYEEVKSAPMKAEPTPFKPISPEGRAMLDATVRNTYDWFVGLVAERRNLPLDKAKELADGRVVTGAIARDLALIDGIGGESAALDWLATKGVDRKLKIVDAKPAAGGTFGAVTGEAVVSAVVRGSAEALGLRLPVAPESALDGLTSVWHPASGENTK